MDLDNVQSQSNTHNIESAKRAISAIRRKVVFKKGTSTQKICTNTCHPCGCKERIVKSKKLTQKAIEKICFSFSDTKILETCDVCGKKHEPSCSSKIEKEAIVEENGQREENLTTLKGVSIITSSCECCGKEDIEVNNLVRIDSGQLMCPDCLASFRKAISYNDG